VAVVIGTASAAVVKALVADPVFFFVFSPVNALMARRAQEEPDTRNVRIAPARFRSPRVAALTARHRSPQHE
jgi:hypothetical protein